LKSTANPGPDRRIRLWLFCAALGALALRLFDLGARPVHTDEAVNAVIVGNLLGGATYRYDPHDHHGPSFFYLTAGLCRLLGDRSLAGMAAWQLRAGAALAGAATVPLAALLAGEAAGGALLAGLLLALGAPFVCYGRTAIHESLLVFAILLALGAGWRFWKCGRFGWAVAAGLGAGLAACTKEAAPLIAGAALLSLAICRMHPPTRRLWREQRSPALSESRLARGALVAAGIALALALLFYSSFGENPAGLRDALRSVPLLSTRALTGAGQEKPWWTYVSWLGRPSPLCLPWFGWLTAAGWVGGAAWSFRTGVNAPLARFLSVLGAILFAAYAATPYKTPWLMLEFLGPVTIVAGIGLARVLGTLPGRKPAIVVACLVAALLDRETAKLCFRFAGNPRNPYAYAPTSPDLGRLTARLDALAAGSPQGRSLVIEVAGADYWPLPWYLRKFPRVGYWSRLPEDRVGAVVLVSADQVARAETVLGPGWHREFFGLRADVLVYLYTRTPPAHA